MRSIARSTLAILLAVGLLDLPLLAAPSKALGLVIQAQEAMLDNSILAVGTTVYPGDTVQTDVGGTLRVKFGTAQIYLLSSSAATFSQRENVIRAVVEHGTVGFSSGPASDIEIEIPQGILRGASGQEAYGQATITGPQEVVIAAYRGSLVLDNDGELHTIPAGKTYRVTMDLEPAADLIPAAPRGQDPGQDSGVRHPKRRRLAFDLLFVGGVAVGSYLIWREITQSPSLPK